MKVKFASSCGVALIFLLSLASASYSAQSSLTSGLHITEEYTDNLFLLPENEEDDFITTAGLSLTGEVLWKTAGMRLTYAPSFLWHADHPEQDNWRHAVDLVGWDDLSRYTRIDIANSYLRTFIPNDQSANPQEATNPLAQPLIPTDPNRRGQGEYYTNVSNVTLTHNFGANESVYAGMRYRIFRETEELAPGVTSSDHDIFEPSAGVVYWFNPNWGFQVDLLVSDRDYKERVDRTQYDGTARFNRRFSRNLNGYIAYRHTYLDYEDDTFASDVTISMPTVGFTYQLEQNATITIGGGYYFQRFDDEAIPDEDGPIINAEIFKGFIYPRGSINLIARSGYTINDQGVEDLGLNIYYFGQISITYSFTQKLSTTLGGSYRYDEYPNETPVRKDNTINARAGLAYQALNWMALRLEYYYADVSSDVGAREYVENSVMLTISIAQPHPIRLN